MLLVKWLAFCFHGHLSTLCLSGLICELEVVVLQMTFMSLELMLTEKTIAELPHRYRDM